MPNLQIASLLWPERINGLEKHPTTQRRRRLVVPIACLEMKGFSKGKDVDVLGTEVHDATSKEVVIDVLAIDVNAPS
jgi:hypothetical protein